VRPTEGVLEAKESELRKKLDLLQERLTPDEKKAIDTIREKLDKFRDTPDSEAAIRSLPMLQRSDLKRSAEPLTNDISDVDGVPFIFHDVDTRRIGYLRLAFKLDEIGTEYVPYIGLLRDILSMVDTDSHKYEELNPLIDLTMGGFSVSTEHYPICNKNGEFTATFEMRGKFFFERSDEAFDLFREILLTSRFKDLKRIREILVEIKNGMQSSFLSAGHSVAAARALSSVLKEAAYSDLMSGVSYYRFICGLLDDYEAAKGNMQECLTYVCGLIFRPENLIADYTGSAEEAEKFRERIASFKSELYTEKHRPARKNIELIKNNEGLTTSGQVVFVCRAGLFNRHGLEYDGVLKVLKVYLGYNYLWVNVRVKGGAYGVMNNYGINGSAYFVSYRDPNLTKTVDVFEGAAEDVASFDADEREMTKLIIGTVSELDIPLTPSARGSRSFAAYMSGVTIEDIQKQRDQVLDCTPADMRRMADYIREFMADKKLVVVGNETLIRENEELFGTVESLL